MTRVLGLALVAIATSANNAAAQTDFLSRARDLMATMPPAADVVTDQNYETTLSPYYGQEPEEQGLAHQNFDEEEVLRITEDTATSRAYANQRDSRLTRPDMDVSLDDLALADDAIGTSDDTLGEIFTGEVGSCEADFEGGYQVGEQFCRRNLSANLQTCSQQRLASVDRDDDWQCLKDTPSYQKVCGGVVSYACTGSTGQACMDAALAVSGGGATLTGSGSTRTLTLPRVPDTAFTCVPVTQQVTLRVRSRADLTSLRIRSYTYATPLQIRMNGVARHTSSVNLLDPDNPDITSFNVTAPLTYHLVDCGKDISCNIIRSGSTGIGTCAMLSDYPHSLDTDITPYIDSPTRKTTVLSDASVDIDMGGDELVTLDITYTSTPAHIATPPRIGLSLSGSCCSHITGEVNQQCN